MEQAAASVPHWTWVAKPKSDQYQFTRAQQREDRHLKCHLQMGDDLHRTQGNWPRREVTSQAKTDFAAHVLFFLKNAM